MIQPTAAHSAANRVACEGSRQGAKLVGYYGQRRTVSPEVQTTTPARRYKQWDVIPSFGAYLHTI